jgi:hypothetical protein
LILLLIGGLLTFSSLMNLYTFPSGQSTSELLNAPSEIFFPPSIPQGGWRLFGAELEIRSQEVPKAKTNVTLEKCRQHLLRSTAVTSVDLEQLTQVFDFVRSSTRVLEGSRQFIELEVGNGQLVFAYEKQGEIRAFCGGFYSTTTDSGSTQIIELFPPEKSTDSSISADEPMIHLPPPWNMVAYRTDQDGTKFAEILVTEGSWIRLRDNLKAAGWDWKILQNTNQQIWLRLQKGTEEFYCWTCESENNRRLVLLTRRPEEFN